MLDEKARATRFETQILIYADQAFNLARWLTRSDADAEDVVQEAMMRAFRFLDSFEGENPRSWLLSIVRNTCLTWLRHHRPYDFVSLDDAAGGDGQRLSSIMPMWTTGILLPDLMLERRDDGKLLDGLLEALPADSREMLVLREIEELSYKDIAAIVGVPIGTVMSRLARARKRLQESWQIAAAESA